MTEPAVSRIPGHLVLAIRMALNWKDVVSFGQLAGRNVLQLAVGIASSSIIAGSLARAEFGAFQYVLSIGATLTVLSLSGLSTVLVQEVSRGNKGALRAITRLRLSWSWLMTVCLLAVAAYYAFVDPKQDLAAALVVAAITMPVALSFDVTGFLVGTSDYRRLSVYPLATQVLVAIATVAAALYWRDAVHVLIATYVVQALCALGSYRLVASAYRPEDNSLSPEAREFGWRLSAANLIPSVVHRLDLLVVGSMIGLEDLAVLALGRLFYDKMRIVMDPLTSLFVPRLYARTGVEAYRFSFRVTVLVLLVLGGFVIALGASMPLVFRMLYPRYMDGVPYAVALMGAYWVSTPNAVFQCLLQHERRTRQVAQAAFLSHAIYLASLPILLLSMGVWGVVVGRYVLSVSNVLASGYFVLRNLMSMRQGAHS